VIAITISGETYAAIALTLPVDSTTDPEIAADREYRLLAASDRRQPAGFVARPWRDI
jgi:hypothetical protein